MSFTPRSLLVSLFVGICLAGSACTPDTPPTADTDGDSASSSVQPGSASTLDTGADASTSSVRSGSVAVATDNPSLMLTEAGSGFESPVLLVADPRGGPDLVVEQSGTVVRNDEVHTVVLDISDDVLFGGEQGLLGVAFHPHFVDNGLVYVNYVDRSGSTVIERFTAGDGRVDVTTRRMILTIEQPAGNHNGGMIAFGPNGYLWIGMGDGGGANDRFEQAQDPHTLLGAMLRIDVDAPGDATYGIPQDNPFADGGDGAREVWATGLRNPWRFVFDGDDLWIADVGQNDIEEVNVVGATVPGLNYGWPIMEGTTCFDADDCDPTPFVTPIAEYSHDDGCSITGGYAYRGEAIPELHGQYFYSDFCSGFLRSTAADGTVTDWTGQTGDTSQVSGFGVGGDGELYMLSHQGTVYRIEAAHE